MILQCDNLYFAHDTHPALEDVSARLHPGQFSVILGPNGAGKSTLLGCLAGLLKPRSGSVNLGSDPILALSDAARAKMLGLLPQGAQTHWAITARVDLPASDEAGEVVVEILDVGPLTGN